VLRWGLRLLALTIPLLLIGFSSLTAWWYEVFRLAGVGCLTAGIGLLLIDYIRTPDPDPGEN
jgi:hypothetical protein